MIVATIETMMTNSVQYQYSDRDARPENVTYLLNPDEIASVKPIA
jgi:hypothetical protein